MAKMAGNGVCEESSLYVVCMYGGEGVQVVRDGERAMADDDGVKRRRRQ